MQQTTAMTLAEQQHEKPIKDLIVDLYDEYRNMEKVADKLDVTRATLLTWRIKVGLDELSLKRIIRDRDNARRQGGAA